MYTCMNTDMNQFDIQVKILACLSNVGKKNDSLSAESLVLG